MALSADDAADRVEQMIALTERLSELMAEDARDFEARRPHQAAGRAEESSRLANIYRHESARIKRDPRLIAGAPAASRQQLTQATQKLEAVMKRHARALEAAKFITEGIVKAIADETAARRLSSAGYGPRARAPQTASAPIALNRRA